MACTKADPLPIPVPLPLKCGSPRCRGEVDARKGFSAAPLGTRGFRRRPSNPSCKAPPSKRHLPAATRLHLEHCFAIGCGPVRLLTLDVLDFCRREGGEPSVVDTAAHLAQLGYSDVRLRRNGGRTAEVGGSVAKHAFVTLRLPARMCAENENDLAGRAIPDPGIEVVVDTRFREQFCIPRATPRYAQALSLTPEVYVGSRAQMLCGARVLCTEMAHSFAAFGMTSPPWRRFPWVLARWHVFDEDGGTPYATKNGKWNGVVLM